MSVFSFPVSEEEVILKFKRDYPRVKITGHIPDSFPTQSQPESDKRRRKARCNTHGESQPSSSTATSQSTKVLSLWPQYHTFAPQLLSPYQRSNYCFSNILHWVLVKVLLYHCRQMVHVIVNLKPHKVDLSKRNQRVVQNRYSVG